MQRTKIRSASPPIPATYSCAATIAEPRASSCIVGNTQQHAKGETTSVAASSTDRRNSLDFCGSWTDVYVSTHSADGPINSVHEYMQPTTPFQATPTNCYSFLSYYLHPIYKSVFVTLNEFNWKNTMFLYLRSIENFKYQKTRTSRLWRIELMTRVIYKILNFKTYSVHDHRGSNPQPHASSVIPLTTPP
jgi:hypothetical protein